jgi:hypothetical protein
MLKEFKPKRTVSPPATRDNIEEMFRKGDLQSAIVNCKKGGHSVADFQDAIEAGARKMLLGHRPGELLSLMYKYRITVQYDVRTLLKFMFDNKDFHAFLKQALRFEVYEGVETEIEAAIQALLDKGQTHDAEAWRRKFRTLRGQITDRV